MPKKLPEELKSDLGPDLATFVADGLEDDGLVKKGRANLPPDIAEQVAKIKRDKITWAAGFVC